MIRGRRHDAGVLAELFDGETRQVWALEPDGQRFYLPNGGATPAVKERAKAGQFTCPVPECESPRFHVHGGTRRRHHFVHVKRPSGGHGPETVFHIQAKAALAAWARAQHPDAAVEEEFRFDGGARVADVLVTFPTGERVAFEVQYSALAIEGPHGWAARHRWYADLGITDVWLFAPGDPHLTQPPRPADLPVDEPHLQGRLGVVQQHLTGEPHPILWFNPQSKKIATPIVEGDPPGKAGWWRPEHLAAIGPRRPRPGDDPVDLYVDELDECTLTPDGVFTPTDEWLAGERDLLAQQAKQAEEEHNRRKEREAAARAAARAAHAATPEQEPSAAEAPVPEKYARPTASFVTVKLWRARPLPAWDDRNPDLQWLKARHGDQLPALLTESHPADHGIDAPVLQWRTAIYRHLVSLGQRSCCEGDAIEALFQLRPAHDPPLLHQAATWLYRAIAAARLTG